MYSKNDAKVVLFVLIYKQKTGLFDVCLKYIAYLCAFLKNLEMTKAELCKSISAKTGCDAQTVLAVVESLMVEVKESLEKGENVYLRGFGSFIVKQRAEKTALFYGFFLHGHLHYFISTASSSRLGSDQYALQHVSILRCRDEWYAH